MCADPGQLAEHYERLKSLGIAPTLSVNHHFTSSLYYRDPDGNEVEVSCDNLPSKQAASDFMKSDAMAEAMVPPNLAGFFASMIGMVLGTLAPPVVRNHGQSIEASLAHRRPLPGQHGYH